MRMPVLLEPTVECSFIAEITFTHVALFWLIICSDFIRVGLVAENRAAVMIWQTVALCRIPTLPALFWDVRWVLASSY